MKISAKCFQVQSFRSAHDEPTCYWYISPPFSFLCRSAEEINGTNVMDLISQHTRYVLGLSKVTEILWEPFSAQTLSKASGLIVRHRRVGTDDFNSAGGARKDTEWALFTRLMLQIFPRTNESSMQVIFCFKYISSLNICVLYAVCLVAGWGGSSAPYGSTNCPGKSARDPRNIKSKISAAVLIGTFKSCIDFFTSGYLLLPTV